MGSSRRRTSRGLAHRAARRTLLRDDYRFQDPWPPCCYPVRGQRAGPRLERWCAQLDLQRPQRPGRVAHDLGLRGQAVRQRPGIALPLGKCTQKYGYSPRPISASSYCFDSIHLLTSNREPQARWCEEDAADSPLLLVWSLGLLARLRRTTPWLLKTVFCRRRPTGFPAGPLRCLPPRPGH